MGITLIKNARILTMNPAQPIASDVLIDGDRISRVGEGLAPPQGGEAIDLAGNTVIPAFWDAHVHFFQTGIRALKFDAGGADSEEALLDMLDTRLRARGEVDGWGYSPVREGELPTRALLDTVSKEKPIFLRRIDGHSSCANSAMMALLRDRIEKLNSVDIERGWLFGEANIAALRFAMERIPADGLIEAAETVAARALSMGCGTIVALVPGVDWMKLLLELDLPVHIVPRLETLNPREAFDLNLSRVGGCLPMVDGSFGSHSALLLQEYSDRPGHLGTLEYPQPELAGWFELAGKLRLQTAVHAIGDGAVEVILQILEKLSPSERPPLPRIEHAELLGDNQIERIAELGISLAMQPAFEALWGGPEGLYSKRLGPRWRSTNRFRDILDAGITIAGSSDSYITPIDPLTGARAAVNHPNELQRISVREALDMFTFGAAKSEGMNNRCGAIEPGKSADIAVISGDIMSDGIDRAEVLMTIVGGEIKYQKGD